MRYCGIAVGPRWQHLCTLEEQREPEPPIRLQAAFYEPGSVGDVVEAVRGMGDVVVAIAAPAGRARDGERRCDAELAARGVAPHPPLDAAGELFHGLGGLGRFIPEPGEQPGPVPEGAYTASRLIETHADGVFCALHGRRMPARRHPFGIRLRIAELEEDHVVDEGGGLWARRIDEIEAAAAALCAHRYAVGHACWVGDPAEGVLVLPGLSLPVRFDPSGAVPPAARLPLTGR